MASNLVNPGSSVKLDTKANILASTGKLAFSTDTNEWFVYYNSLWYKAELPLTDESGNPDMGFTQDNS